MEISQKLSLLRAANPFNLLGHEEQERLAERVSLHQLQAGETLFRAGDKGDAFYIIASGRVRVVGQDSTGREVTLNTLSKSDTFGEIALLHDSPRTAMVRAIEDLVLLRLNREDFQRLMQENPEIRSQMERSLTHVAIRNFLKQFTVLETVPAQVLRGLVSKLEMIQVKAGDAVIRQGEAADKFYIVKSGTLRVTRRENGADQDMGRIAPGEYFGELGLDSGRPRAADVVADTPCELFILSREGFDTALQASPDLRQRIQHAASSYETRPVAPPPEADGPAAAAGTPLSEEDIVGRGWRRLLESPPVAAAKKPQRTWWQKLFTLYPFTPQHDMTDCGAACLSMLLKYYGSSLSLSRLRDITNVDRDGASLWSLAQAAQTLGFSACGLQISKDAVTEVATPAIVHWEGVHYIVLYEATDKHVVVGDPGVGIRRIPTEEFKRGFTGRVLELAPTASLVKTEKSPSPYTRFFTILGKRIPAVAWILLLSLAINLFALAFPIFTGIVLDKVLKTGGASDATEILWRFRFDKISLLNFCFISILLITLVQGVTNAVRQFLIIHLSTKADLDLLEDFLQHTMRLPMKFFDQRRVGDVTSRLSETDNIRQAMVGTIPSVFLDIVMAAGSTAYLIHLNWKLTLVVMGTVPFFLGLMLGFTPIIRRNRRKYVAKKTDQSAYLIESISGIGTVKMMGIEPLVRQHWKDLYLETLELGARGARLEAVHSAGAMFLATITAPLFLWFGAYQALNGSLTTGQLIAFVGITGNIITPILRLVNSWQQLQEVRNSAERLHDVFDAEPEQAARGRTALLDLPRLRGSICFENVTFKYSAGQDTPIIANLSFTIKPGQTVAVVGRSGSGKSTLAKLILGLYLPTEGRVLIDGHDTRILSLRGLRSRVGVVPQEVFLFSGTIRENVAPGVKDPPFDKIMNACRMANAHGFVCDLGLGYETKVGERGVGLSGGQRQRVAMARALYRDPDILILDEATSALDAESERTVQDSLDTAMKGRTRIVIAHRLSTVQNADWTLVLDKGSLLEQGTHDELVKRNGLYAGLVRQQLAI